MITRMPRPLSFTEVSRTSTKENKKSNQLKLIITHYINNSLTLNQRQVTIEDISYQLSIPVQTVLKELYRQTNKMGDILGYNKNIKDVLMETLGMTLNLGLRNQSRIEEQSNILRNSQSGSYKPFISSTYNQSLDLLLKSQASFQSILKLLLDASKASQNGPTFNIFGTSNPNEDIKDPNQKAIGITEAMALIAKAQDEGSWMPSISLLEDVEELKSLPEVRANHQAMVASDGMKIAKNIKISHMDRRTEEENIDEENFT